MPEINYVWDPIEDNIILEYDENGDTIVAYTTEPTLYGSLISQNRRGAISHYHFDGVGNTTELTNASGDVTDAQRYSAFGKVTTVDGITVYPFQYVGQLGYYRDSDTNTHYYVRRRFYHLTLGRWTTIDPIPYSDSMTLYGYVSNNPMNRIDPSGMFMGIVYGSFCGWSRRGERGAAIDPLDRACEEHDECIGTLKMVICQPLRLFACNYALCKAAEQAARFRGCERAWPAGPGRDACMNFAVQLLVLCVTLVPGNTLVTPFPKYL